MNVMLLAAGEGRRLNPHTLKVPKPAMPFLNIPLAAHALSFISPVDYSKLVVNTFHLPNQVHSLFQKISPCQEVLFSDEKVLLGSGGGLKAAMHLLDPHQDTLLMNADEIILPENEAIILEAIKSHRESGAIATLLVMKHAEVGSKFGGVWANKSSILGFGKNAIEGADCGWHFIGIQILSPKIFQYLPDGESNILYDAVTNAIAAGESAQIFPIQCEWFETGNPTDYIHAHKTCLAHLTAPQDSFQRRALEKSLKLFSSESFEIRNNVNSVILKSASAVLEGTIEGFAVLGKDCHVHKDFHGSDIVVAEGVSVLSTSPKTEHIFVS